MANINVLNLEGKTLREIELADAVFGITPHKQALFDAVMVQRASLHQGTHDTKGKAEVRGGGKKPWRQKGTGRARQGSIRSPQWRGGGTVFGPTPRSYTIRINRKVRRLALRSALSQKVLDQALVVVESLGVENVRTKEFVKVMGALNLENKTLFIYKAGEDVEKAFLSMRNLPNTMILSVDGLNVFDILNADALVFTEAAAKEAGEVFA